ncbi:MAG: hypothetical protein KDD62_01685, partial [Bdellovibrionales bacterium]|nr:hypothetical protein [Bdellovibrionales bacterium]
MSEQSHQHIPDDTLQEMLDGLTFRDQARFIHDFDTKQLKGFNPKDLNIDEFYTRQVTRLPLLEHFANSSRQFDLTQNLELSLSQLLRTLQDVHAQTSTQSRYLGTLAILSDPCDPTRLLARLVDLDKSRLEDRSKKSSDHLSLDPNKIFNDLQRHPGNPVALVPLLREKPGLSEFLEIQQLLAVAEGRGLAPFVSIGVLNPTDGTPEVVVYDQPSKELLTEFERLWKNARTELLDGLSGFVSSLKNSDKVTMRHWESVEDFLPKVLSLFHRFTIKLIRNKIGDRILTNDYAERLKELSTGLQREKIKPALKTFVKNIPHYLSEAMLQALEGKKIISSVVLRNGPVRSLQINECTEAPFPILLPAHELPSEKIPALNKFASTSSTQPAFLTCCTDGSMELSEQTGLSSTSLAHEEKESEHEYHFLLTTKQPSYQDIETIFAVLKDNPALKPGSLGLGYLTKESEDVFLYKLWLVAPEFDQVSFESSLFNLSAFTNEIFQDINLHPYPPNNISYELSALIDIARLRYGRLLSHFGSSSLGDEQVTNLLEPMTTYIRTLQNLETTRGNIAQTTTLSAIENEMIDKFLFTLAATNGILLPTALVDANHQAARYLPVDSPSYRVLIESGITDEPTAREIGEFFNRYPAVASLPEFSDFFLQALQAGATLDTIISEEVDLFLKEHGQHILDACADNGLVSPRQFALNLLPYQICRNLSSLPDVAALLNNPDSVLTAIEFLNALTTEKLELCGPRLKHFGFAFDDALSSLQAARLRILNEDQDSFLFSVDFNATVCVDEFRKLRSQLKAVGSSLSKIKDNRRNFNKEIKRRNLDLSFDEVS